MAELLALFKSNAKFHFQSNSQSWFPDSVAVLPFVVLPLETLCEEMSLPTSVLRWGGILKVHQEIWQEGEGKIMAKLGQRHVHFTEHL